MDRRFIGIVFLVVFALSGCTSPGETTTVAAATGGAVGAGLGAVVGNQTGSTAGGMAVGAVAGAATGALVGNAFEAQEEAIRSQDEAIERQDRMIQAQQSEINELRSISQDRVSFHDGAGSSYSPAPFERTSAYSVPPVSAAAGRQQGQTTAMTTEVEKAPVGSAAAVETGRDFVPVRGRVDPEASAKDPHQYAMASSKKGLEPLSQGAFGTPQSPSTASQPEGKGSYAWTDTPKTGTVVAGAGTGAQDATSETYARYAMDSPECQRADKEVDEAYAAKEVADKLFHYRRALRLCPGNPTYHNGLGEVYRSLNRTEDAEFEFKEALKLDPNFTIARRNLDALSQ